MPTNPEQFPSFEATSQPRPVQQDGRPAVDAFDPSEFFYRRYSISHFADGYVLPQTFSFPRPSFNRSKFSRPEDVLHTDCCDGKERPGWGVLECPVLDLSISKVSGDGRTFTLYPRHIPKTSCYAHSELWCESLISKDAKPSESAKEKLRIALSRVLKVKIPATA